MLKKLAVCIMIFAVCALADVFCDGWESGWEAGWCYGQSFCTAPLPPICPIPRFNEDGYVDGYNRGFLAGLNARKSREY